MIVVEHPVNNFGSKRGAGAARLALNAGAVTGFRGANRAASTTSAGIRTRAIRNIMVVEAAGRLGDVAQDLDRSIQLALAEGPRGVVCDLSNALGGADPVAVEVLAMAGRHVRDWPGIPVAVACPDPRVREALRAHPLGGHLIVSPSLFAAVSDVLATPALLGRRLLLAPHPTACRASRDFVTRTLLDWRLGRVIPFASLVVSELVSGSAVNAGTDIDLALVWNLDALRLTVRDHGPVLMGQPHSVPGLRKPGLAVVAGLSRAFGFLPTSDGGQVAWSVLEAHRSRPSSRQTRPVSAAATQDSPEFADGRGSAELPFCAGSIR